MLRMLHVENLGHFSAFKLMYEYQVINVEQDVSKVFYVSGLSN